jgi:uncharacterized membrane protein
VTPITAPVDRGVDAVARTHRLDPVVDRLQAGVEALPRPIRDALRGRWLGIPLHPVLTDVTIGAWTGSFVADVIGGHDGRAFGRRLLLLGNVAAVPTIAAGLADWSRLDRAGRRVGLVHAALNVATTALYVRSYRARRRGRHGVGVAWGLVAASLATVGGHLGGMLVFRYSGGVDRVPDQLRGRVAATSFATESVRIG